MKDKIKELASKYHNEIIGIRRHLHAHPELSYKEVETAKYVCSILDKYEISYQKGIGGHGIVAHIGNGKETVALRADMDALPILEKNEVDYKSQNVGVMHACGHDVHTSSLLGAAMILKSIEDSLIAKVRMIFQPAEEKLPGGASLMIKEGVLENPKPKHIIGQHVHPPLEAGKVGLKAGMYMASADEIYIEVQGKGGHGALPQDCKDPVITSANILVALQQIISRHAPPTVPSVLTFGKIYSEGGATNVIPYKVFIEGTFRTMNEEWREKALRLIATIAEDTAKMHGLKAVVTIPKGYPYLQNDEVLTPKLKVKMQEYLGDDKVVDLPIRMTAEDFSYYTHHVPACFYRLGTGNKSKGITSPVHTDTFNVDEDSLLVGAGLMAWLAYSGISL